jgi:hypothetical protein
MQRAIQTSRSTVGMQIIMQEILVKCKQEIIILRITGIQTLLQTTEILRQTQLRIHVRIQTQGTHKTPADKQLMPSRTIAGQQTKKEEMRQRRQIHLQIRISRLTRNRTTINQIVKTVGLIRLQPEIILHQAEIIRMQQTTQITQVQETIQMQQTAQTTRAQETIQILQQQINRILLQTVRQDQVQTQEEGKN